MGTHWNIEIRPKWGEGPIRSHKEVILEMWRGSSELVIKTEDKIKERLLLAKGSLAFTPGGFVVLDAESVRIRRKDGKIHPDQFELHIEPSLEGALRAWFARSEAS